MIAIKRLHHIQICVPPGREQEAREFYSEVIGFTEIEKPEELLANGGLWFRVNEIEFHIGTEQQINQSKRHPAFEVTDLAVARKLLESNNVKIKEETQIPGMNRFSFFDPFNNRIELLEIII